jgi:hypothetical protein
MMGFRLRILNFMLFRTQIRYRIRRCIRNYGNYSRDKM